MAIIEEYNDWMYWRDNPKDLEFNNSLLSETEDLNELGLENDLSEVEDYNDWRYWRPQDLDLDDILMSQINNTSFSMELSRIHTLETSNDLLLVSYGFKFGSEGYYAIRDSEEQWIIYIRQKMQKLIKTATEFGSLAVQQAECGMEMRYDVLFGEKSHASQFFNRVEPLHPDIAFLLVSPSDLGLLIDPVLQENDLIHLDGHSCLNNVFASKICVFVSPIDEDEELIKAQFSSVQDLNLFLFHHGGWGEFNEMSNLGSLVRSKANKPLFSLKPYNYEFFFLTLSSTPFDNHNGDFYHHEADLSQRSDGSYEYVFRSKLKMFKAMFSPEFCYIKDVFIDRDNVVRTIDLFKMRITRDQYFTINSFEVDSYHRRSFHLKADTTRSEYTEKINKDKAIVESESKESCVSSKNEVGEVNIASIVKIIENPSDKVKPSDDLVISNEYELGNHHHDSLPSSINVESQISVKEVNESKSKEYLGSSQIKNKTSKSKVCLGTCLSINETSKSKVCQDTCLSVNKTAKCKVCLDTCLSQNITTKSKVCLDACLSLNNLLSLHWKRVDWRKEKSNRKLIILTCLADFLKDIHVSNVCQDKYGNVVFNIEDLEKLQMMLNRYCYLDSVEMNIIRNFQGSVLKGDLLSELGYALLIHCRVRFEEYPRENNFPDSFKIVKLLNDDSRDIVKYHVFFPNLLCMVRAMLISLMSRRYQLVIPEPYMLKFCKERPDPNYFRGKKCLVEKNLFSLVMISEKGSQHLSYYESISRLLRSSLIMEALEDDAGDLLFTFQKKTELEKVPFSYYLIR